MFSLFQRSLLVGAALLPCCGLLKADFVSTVDSTNPLAYFRLESVNGPSEVNGYTTMFNNLSTVSSPGAPIGEPSNYVNLSRNAQQYVSTSLSGNVNTAGSIMAWVDLASLPSSNNAIYYVAGESQFGNDFDVQFQNDNHLYFFTAGGSSVSYTPDASSLVGQWHMILTTFDATSNTQDIYWDGQLVTSGSVGSNTNKQGAFWIGASSVFGGRYLDGGIDEVAVWNTALTAGEVADIYSSASAPSGPSTAPEPASVLMMVGGMAGLAVVRKRFRRT